MALDDCQQLRRRAGGHNVDGRRTGCQQQKSADADDEDVTPEQAAKMDAALGNPYGSRVSRSRSIPGKRIRFSIRCGAPDRNGRADSPPTLWSVRVARPENFGRGT